MKQVSGEVKGFGGLIEKNSAQIKKMGRQMTLSGGAIVGTIGLMVKAYGTFDEAMTRSLAIMGKVSPAMRTEMAKTAKQLSTETTFAAKDLAEAYFFLASAGMSAEASVSALAPVARFAQAGTFDLAQATDLLTDAQTALGLSSTDVAKNEENLIRVSDVLVGANTLANASVLQFSESLTTKAAAALVNVNKEVEEGVAVLAAYADKGVKGRLAGTRLTMMLNGLFAATRENKKAWDEAGISLFEADESMRSIADIIGDMEGYLGTMTVKQREAALATLGFNVRTKDSILTLMGSSEKIKEWTKKLKEMGGITKEVSDKQLEAFNAQMTLAKNTIMGAAISIGKSLAPMIIKLTGKIKTVAESLSRWIEKHPKLTGAIAKLALGIGTLLTVLGPLMMMLPGLVIILPKIAAGFAMITGPVGLVTAGVVALGAGIGILIDKYKEKTDAEIEAIRTETALADALKLRKTLIGADIVTWERWKEIYEKHGKSYKRVMRAIATLPEYKYIRDQLKELRETQAEWTETLGTTLIPKIGKLSGVLNLARSSLGGVAYAFKTALPPARDVTGVLEKAVAKFKEVGDKGKKAAEDVGGSWREAFYNIIHDAALFTSSLGALFDQLTTNQMARIDAEYEARKTAIEKSLMTEASKAKAIERLEAGIEKKRKAAARSAAKRSKAVALLEAIVNTASAIVEALPNIPLSIAVGIMGAVQTALIAAQPLPSFQAGGRIEEGGIVGERGPELFVPERPGFIIPARETRALLGRPQVLLQFSPVFYLSTLDPLTARDVVREQIGPELIDMLKAKILLPEFQEALGTK